MEPSDPKRERVKRGASGRGVNFSPIVQAISDDGSGGDVADNEERDDKDDTTPDPEGDGFPRVTAAKGAGHAHTGPPSGTTDSSDKGLLSPETWKKKKRELVAAGFSPRLSLISPRAQASVGVSPANTADAPSGQRSIRAYSPSISPTA